MFDVPRKQAMEKKGTIKFVADDVEISCKTYYTKTERDNFFDMFAQMSKDYSNCYIQIAPHVNTSQPTGIWSDAARRW